MNRKGDHRDYAPMESFFHTLKTELVRHRVCKTRREANADSFECIEGFYNRDQIHPALGFITPAGYGLIRLAA